MRGDASMIASTSALETFMRAPERLTWTAIAPVHAFRISLVVALSSPGRRDHRRSNLESHAGCGGREAAPILDGALMNLDIDPPSKVLLVAFAEVARSVAERREQKG